jgi:hypothetical protein
MQPDGCQTALPWSYEPPFEVVAPGRMKCPHQISLDRASELPEEFLGLLSDPLVREMLPVPKIARSPAYFGLSPAEEEQALVWAEFLERMSAPRLTRGGTPMWLVDQKALAGELMISNVAPLMLTRAEPRHTAALFQIGAMAQGSPRKLVVLGSDRLAVPPVYRRLTTALGRRDLPDFDWEAIGATVLKERMLGRGVDTTP